MNRCAVRQNARAAREETSHFSLTSALREPVFCPKPRRITQLSTSDPIKPMPPIGRQLGQQAEPPDPKPGADVLDIILAKGARGGGCEVASSPPYFCGSPPSRAANPLVLDVRFGEENAAPPVPLPMPTVSAAPSSSAGGRKGYVRTKLGAKPAAVRIEGFDCRDKGGRRTGCNSVSAVA